MFNKISMGFKKLKHPKEYISSWLMSINSKVKKERMMWLKEPSETFCNLAIINYIYDSLLGVEYIFITTSNVFFS